MQRVQWSLGLPYPLPGVRPLRHRLSAEHSVRAGEMPVSRLSVARFRVACMSHIEQSDGFPAASAQAREGTVFPAGSGGIPAGQEGESSGARWRTDWDSRIEDVSGSCWVNAVACTVLDGREVAVVGTEDATVRMLDMATGLPAGEPLTGHEDSVRCLATAVLDGRPVAVTGSEDGTARVWDLDARQQIGQMLELDRGPVNAVAATVLNGRPVAVTAGDDGTARLWDLATCEQIGDHLVSAYSDVWTVATAVLGGRPVAVTSEAEGPLQVIDLATGRPLGELTGHDGLVQDVATTVLDGCPIAVTGGADDTMRVWDLVTCEQLYSRPTNEPLAIAAGLVDGRPVAVTTAQPVYAGGPPDVISSQVLRVWDLTGREPAGQVVDGPWFSKALALTPRGRLLVSSRAGLAVLTHH
ncbi:WD40 repeat domain-containing protein [Streptomyces sp. NPDC058049]|uniref:WD40 repeat domain-containing protein n=1 Tax=Streptomyces sp. NPDC058049 TaxID=3346314 RepID=UPI0036E46681